MRSRDGVSKLYEGQKQQSREGRAAHHKLMSGVNFAGQNRQ
jgi:hypothetical protein